MRRSIPEGSRHRVEDHGSWGYREPPDGDGHHYAAPAGPRHSQQPREDQRYAHGYEGSHARARQQHQTYGRSGQPVPDGRWDAYPPPNDGPREDNAFRRTESGGFRPSRDDGRRSVEGGGGSGGGGGGGGGDGDGGVGGRRPEMPGYSDEHRTSRERPHQQDARVAPLGWNAQDRREGTNDSGHEGYRGYPPDHHHYQPGRREEVVDAKSSQPQTQPQAQQPADDNNAQQDQQDVEELDEDGNPMNMIYEFPIEKLQTNRRVLIVGKTGSGKTVMLMELVSYLSRHFDAGMAWTPTTSSADDFRTFMPDSCIHEEFTADELTEAMDALIKKLRDLVKRGIKKKVFVILDDCMFDKKILSSTAARDIHMNGRHCGILFVNLVQYAIDIPKALRTQIDYVFATLTVQLSMRKALYESFFGMFDSLADFTEAMRVCAENYGCIVYDSTANKAAISECVFWYKAPPPEARANRRFLLGGRNYWKLHYLLYKGPPPLEEDDDPIPALSRSRRQGQAGEPIEGGGSAPSAKRGGEKRRATPGTSKRKAKGAGRTTVKVQRPNKPKVTIARDTAGGGGVAGIGQAADARPNQGGIRVTAGYRPSYSGGGAGDFSQQPHSRPPHQAAGGAGGARGGGGVGWGGDGTALEKRGMTVHVGRPQLGQGCAKRVSGSADVGPRRTQVIVGPSGRMSLGGRMRV